MEIGPYLAMTAAEFDAAEQLPRHAAWMACHFSPYGTGLDSLPPALAPGSLLILNDRIPFRGHDPVQVASQLAQTLAAQDCCGLLLDLQRPGTEEAISMAGRLVSSLPCPVAVSEGYARHLDCPVFLSPCPHHVHLREHIAPWAGRELWLDLALDAQTIALTADGAAISPVPLSLCPEKGHREESLHCHYSIETGADLVRFTLWRTMEDLETLAQEAEGLGIQTFVGLWSELYSGK